MVPAAALAACRGDSEKPQGAGSTQIERQLLEQASPATAAGQVLGLTRVIIPPGQTIAPHTHPGPQLAVVVQGTLTYTVIRGEVTVTRSAGTPEARQEVVRGGTVVELKPGDSLLETTDLVHSGGNSGKTPVVIYVSTLFPSGAPASSPAQ